MNERVETPYGTLCCLKGDLIAANLRKFGQLSRCDLAAAVGLIEHGDTVIDIGSHIGSFGTPFARTVGLSGTVVDLEAMKDPVALLEQKIRAGGRHDIGKTVWAAIMWVVYQFESASCRAAAVRPHSADRSE